MMEALLMVVIYMESLLNKKVLLMVAQKLISGPHPDDSELYRVTSE